MASLAEMLMGYLPKGASPVFGTTMPQEQAMVPPTGLDQAVGGAINSMATLPQRAIQNSQFALNTGVYDPSVPLEAAMTTMGATPFGSGMAGTSPVFGAGPIKAYHGSPHDFDKFDLSKIGTGEGAQAYGHGLYFAESEPVAKTYRDILSGEHTINGAPVSEVAKSWDAFNPQAEPKIAAYIHSYGDVPSARAALLEQGDKKTVNMLDVMHGRGDIKSPGHMYEVNINADPAHFLDWDKPLSQQHPQTQAAIKQAMGPNWEQFKSANAGDAVKQGFIAPGTDTTAAKLSEAGIPGIKYLDQGSRGVPTVNGRVQSAGPGKYNIVDDFGVQAGPFPTLEEAQQYLGTPKQTSNYVVFNDKLIDILRKYGLAGAAATGAMSPAYGPQQPNLTTQALMEGS